VSSDPDEGEPPDATPQGMPRGVRVAAAVWLLYGGGLGFLGTLVAAGVAGCVGAGLVGLYAFMFFSGGARAQDATLPGMRLPAVWSLAVGTLHLLAAAALLHANWDRGPIGWFTLYALSLLWCSGFALLAAGGLALRDADAYQEWREVFGPGKRRP
jgi:hypothetical protein